MAGSVEITAGEFGLCQCLPQLLWRGANSVHAFGEMFVRGLLISSDLLKVHGEMRAQLTTAIFRSMGLVPDKLTLSIRQHLGHLPERDLALYCLRHFFLVPLWNGRRDLQAHRQALAEWVKAFPNGRTWVPLLLAGSLAEEGPGGNLIIMKMVGPMLWELRNELVAEDWLRESDKCSGWYGINNLDILKLAQKLLNKNAPIEWGLTAEQHADLLAWCDRMKARRAELKSAKEI